MCIYIYTYIYIYVICLHMFTLFSWPGKGAKRLSIPSLAWGWARCRWREHGWSDFTPEAGLNYEAGVFLKSCDFFLFLILSKKPRTRIHTVTIPRHIKALLLTQLLNLLQSVAICPTELQSVARCFGRTLREMQFWRTVRSSTSSCPRWRGLHWAGSR